MSAPKKAVCIFEDSKDIQLYLKLFFGKRGFEPVVSEDASDAVGVVRRHDPVLILMDVHMPGKDGIEACREIRAAGVQTRLALLTGQDFDEIKNAGRAAGADACLTKPFRLSDLDALLAPAERKDAPETAAPEPAREGPGKILFVDDDPISRELAVLFLQRAGYAVAAGGNLEQGLALARQEKIRLAILDIILPDGSGYDLCKEIRRLYGPTLPVVFLTSMVDTDSRLKGFEVGGTDYVSKPFSIQELVARVRVHLTLSTRIDDLSMEKQRLELRERARQDMIDSLVHDIKTPLTSIKGTLSLVREYGMLKDRDIEKLLGISENAADLLVMTINDILDLSRSDHQEIEASPAETKPAAILDKSASFFEAQCRRQGIALRQEAPQGETPVFTDPVLTIRILVNLVSNAVKYAAAGKEVLLTFARRGDRLRYEVLDRGPGIPAEHHNQVFDKYFRLKAAGEAPDMTSSGIGLSFCRAAAEALGGRIWVEARPGGGSRFVLEVPEARRPKA